MLSSQNGNGATVPAVDRAAQILKTLASSEFPLGVSELSRQLGLNKSTVHDIVTALSHHKLLERDDASKTYRLGHALAELANHVGARNDLQTLAHPRLVTLAHAVQETVLLGTFHDGHVTIVDKEEAPHDVKITSPVGLRLYYSVGAFGKIFLAAMSDAQATKLLHDKPLRAFTPKSITKPPAYRAALRRVRALGYALDDEEYLAGVRAAAAPVVDARGYVVAALCVVGFRTRLSYEQLLRLAKQTRDAARKISRELGAVEYPAWKGIA
jgi:IclR family KDG regulon transcriptional repressor